MNARRLLFVSSVAVAIAACSIGKPIPQATTYIVDPPAANASVPRRAPALRMGNVRVAAPYASNALVYRLDEVRYTSDPYHAFAADPAAMFANEIANWLDHSGPFSTVAQPGSARSAPYVLEATIHKLYGDFRGGTPPTAVLSVQFILIEQGGGRPKVIYESTIARRVELTKASPDALVRGYSTALAEILTQLARDLDDSLEAP